MGKTFLGLFRKSFVRRAILPVLSGAEIEHVVNEAGLLAVKDAAAGAQLSATAAAPQPQVSDTLS